MSEGIRIVKADGKTLVVFNGYNARVKEMRMAPLKVTLRLGSPVSVKDYLHLDGILWHAALQDQLGRAFWNQDRMQHYCLRLPLKVRTQKGKRIRHYYASSVGFFEEGSTEGVSAWRKRRDFPPEYGRIDLSRGIWRMYDEPITYVSAPSVTFYAVGCPEEVERLLRTHISHVGYKASQGYGYVRRVEVQEISEDRSVVWDGVLRRPVPFDGCPFKFKDPITGIYNYQPPYWRPSSRTLCYMPGSTLVRREKAEGVVKGVD